MSADNPLSDVPSLEEDLVAYLDGELDDPGSKRLEERLASDESARERLRALATSWNLLDHLPRAAMDEAFTRTTVELVVAEARKEIAAEQAALPTRKRRRWIAAAVAGLAAAMVGFTAVVVAWPDKNEQLLRDLPVVQNLEQYEVLPQADSIKFLRDLESQELFVADAWAAENPDSQLPIDEDGVLTPDEVATRRAFVEELPPERKVQLRKLYERFKGRPEDEQDRLRELDVVLRSDPNESRLRAVLQSYHDWLPTLTPLERAELLALPAEGALAEIRDIKRRELDNLKKYAKWGPGAKPGPGPLTPEIVKTIELWLEERAWNQRDEILAKATSEQREWYQDQVSDDRKKGSLVQLWTIRGPGSPRAPRLTREEWESLLAMIPAIKSLLTSQGTPKGKGKADDLLSQLTKEAREHVRKELSTATTLEDQQKLLFGWYFRAQFARQIAGGAISSQELQRFFNEELSEEDRKRMSQLSPDRFRRDIRRKYFFEKELPPQPWWDGKRGRGRDGGRGPDDEHRRFEGHRRGGPGQGIDREHERRGDDDDGRRKRNDDNERSES
jgi:hypothetical protein